MSRFSSIVFAVAVAAVAFLALATPRAEGAVSCGTVASAISPCINYLTKNGPLGGCCPGVKKLNAAAASTPDRQTACTCLKNLSARLPGLNYGKAAGLPKTCGVNVPFPISPSTDCSKVK